MTIVLGIFCLFLGCILVVGAARTIQVEIGHFAVHNKLFPSDFLGVSKALLNWLATEIGTTLIFVQDRAAYLKDHVMEHHDATRTFASKADPDAAFLLELGFLPGMSKRSLWLKLLATLFSPRFHAVFFMARFKSNFVDAPRYRRLMAIVWLGVLCVLAAKTSAVVILFLYLVPLGVLYHQSALLQFLSEHLWYEPLIPGESPKDRHARLSHGRFTGEPLPPEGLKGKAFMLTWLRWILATIFIHGPVRLAVLVGSLNNHDVHHQAPWADFHSLEFQRNQLRAEGKVTSREHWGLGSAIDAVFDHISRLPR